MSDWPLCNAVRKLNSVVLSNSEGEVWDHMQWKRRLETFGDGDSPKIMSDRGSDNIW
jgi:acid phosphatase